MVTLKSRLPELRTQQVLAAVGLGVVGSVVLALTLFKSQFVIGDLWDPVAHQQRSLDLQLLNGFVNPSIWYGPWTNSAGNILLFLPLGALLFTLFRTVTRYPILSAVLIGAAASLFIEVSQFVFAVGYTDVDDLLFNTVGAGLGAWGAAWLLRRRHRTRKNSR